MAAWYSINSEPNSLKFYAWILPQMAKKAVMNLSDVTIDPSETVSLWTPTQQVKAPPQALLEFESQVPICLKEKVNSC